MEWKREEEHKVFIPCIKTKSIQALLNVENMSAPKELFGGSRFFLWF